MERRIGSRAQVDLPVSAFVDGFQHPCRAVDLSVSGMVLERTKSLATRVPLQMSAFEVRLAGARPIRVRARTVWSQDRLQAVRFVVMNDVDRLTIAEHLDRLVRLREPLH
jgi:PilZ domain